MSENESAPTCMCDWLLPPPTGLADVLQRIGGQFHMESSVWGLLAPKMLCKRGVTVMVEQRLNISPGRLPVPPVLEDRLHGLWSVGNTELQSS